MRPNPVTSADVTDVPPRTSMVVFTSLQNLCRVQETSARKLSKKRLYTRSRLESKILIKQGHRHKSRALEKKCVISQKNVKILKNSQLSSLKLLNS